MSITAMNASVCKENPWKAGAWLVLCLGLSVIVYRQKEWPTFGIMMFVSGMWAEDFGARLRVKYPMIDKKLEYTLWERKDRP